MRRIIINYEISRSTALGEDRAEYGTAAHNPSDAELAFLAESGRAYLDKHPTETFRPPTFRKLARKPRGR
jgi:hypothetical protein